MKALEPNIDSLIEEEDVEELIEALKHENYLIRKEAAVGLKIVGDERAVPALINALHYTNWQKDYIILTSVRQKAAEALGVIGDSRATSYLIKALDTDPDEEVRWNAAWALGEIGDEESVKSLIKALKDNRWTVRKNAANSLGKIGDEEAIDPLIQALGDRDWHVRMYAAVALGKMKDERAIPTLLEALNDEDSDVRFKAGSALVNIGEMTVDPLIKLLSSRNWQLRGRSVDVLGKIGDARALDQLIKILTPGKNWDKHRQVRGKAAVALGRIGNPAAIEILQEVNLSDDYKFVREKAEDAIFKIRNECVSDDMMNYDNAEVCFDFPNDWEIFPTEDQTKILKGQYANSSINFSLNRKSEVEDLSSSEFGEMLKNVLSMQNSSLIYENKFKRDGMDIFEIIAENKDVKTTRIVIISFKMEDLLYYMWFAGNPSSFKDASDSINLMIDSFFIHPTPI